MTHIVSSTPLNEESAPSQKPLPDMTTYTKHYREKDSHAQVEFEKAILACEWRQTHALDCAVTGSASSTLWEHFGIYYHFSVSISVCVFSAPLRTAQETQKFCISIMLIWGLDRIICLGCKTCDVCAVFVFNIILFRTIATVRPFTPLKELDLEIRQPVFLYYWTGFDQKHQT